MIGAKTKVVKELRRGVILESEICGQIWRWYERKVRRDQYSTVAKSWTMDNEPFEQIVSLGCHFVVYTTPSGVRYAPLYGWKSICLNAKCGLKRYPICWYDSLPFMLESMRSTKDLDESAQADDELDDIRDEHPPSMFEEFLHD